MKKIVVFGACSAIAQETIKCFAENGAELYLLDLSAERLNILKNDLQTKYKSKISISEFNAADIAKNAEAIDKIIAEFGDFDAALIAYGTLPKHTEIIYDYHSIIKEFNINALSIIALVSVIANYFEKKSAGTLAVISSVAGDRGRQSNYIYGAAKGTLSIFLQGLRNRFGKTNIKIITIKPGMVDSPMTAEMPKSPLFAKPEVVGKGIYKAMLKGKDIAYLPGFWRIIMFIIKHIPEKIFKKLSL